MVNDRFRDFLTVCLVTAVVLDLDVEVQAALACVRLGTLRVRALKHSLDLVGAAAIVLLPATQISLPSRSLEVLGVIVELLDLKDVFQMLVPFRRLIEDS